MTSPRLAKLFPDGSRVRGFTLVEMLIVIGILGVLLGLILGTVMYAHKRARQVRARQDLQAIAAALEQYKADFRSYPMRDANSLVGSRILAWALIAIGPNSMDGAGPVDRGGNDARDQAGNLVPGPGFRAVKGGKIYQPYLPVDRFHLRPVNPSNLRLGYEMLDVYESPIEYYPKRHEAGTGKIASPQNLGLVGTSAMDLSYRFDSTDGPIPIDVLKRRLGDTGLLDNTILPPETLRFTGNFILASPGVDGQWYDPAGIDSKDPNNKLRDDDDIFYDSSGR